jgi:hypothetical protein
MEVDGVVAERDGIRKLDRLSGLSFDLVGGKGVKADDAAALAGVRHDRKVIE